MLGFAVAQVPYLTVEEVTLLGTGYCGVCQALRDEFGELMGVLTNYDAQFLSLLTAAQRKSLPSEDRARCPARAYLREVRILGDTDAIVYSAAVSVLLAGEKLADSIRDRIGPARCVPAQLFVPQMVHAQAILERTGFPTHALMTARQSQAAVEAPNGAALPLRTYLEPTADIVGEIFGHTSYVAGQPENTSTLRTLGTAVGRLVALADACEDLACDRRNETFNPISAAWSLRARDFVPVVVLAEVCYVVIEQLYQVKLALSRVHLPHLRGIVENVLTRGFPERLALSLTRLWVRNHWTGETPSAVLPLLDVAPCGVCNVPHHLPRKALWRNKRAPVTPGHLWLVADLFPSASALAQECGFPDAQQYLLACTLPALVSPATSGAFRLQTRTGAPLDFGQKLG